MKNKTISTLIVVSITTKVFAHPGHSHSDLSTTEFAWHHLLTGGCVGVSVIAGAWFVRQTLANRKRTAVQESLKR